MKIEHLKSNQNIGTYIHADIMENLNMQKYTTTLEALADRGDGIL